MAAVSKFRRENLLLRKGALIMKRHDGAPKPEPPPKAPDPDLLNWDVNLIRGSKNEFRGVVMARDYKSAVEAAIKRFQIKEWQVPRLVVTVRPRPVHR